MKTYKSSALFSALLSLIIMIIAKIQNGESMFITDKNIAYFLFYFVVFFAISFFILKTIKEAKDKKELKLRR